MIRNKPHKNLDLWTKAIEFVVLIYEITKALPKEEEFGLSEGLSEGVLWTFGESFGPAGRPVLNSP
jgi:hypothetical protein